MIKFFLIILTVFFTQVHAAEPLKVWLSEDEWLLPPYLLNFKGAEELNVTSAEHRKRAAEKQELLDWGDSFSLPAHLSFQVLMNEGLQWVGGGVFRGSLVGQEKVSLESPFRIEFDQGWMKVWMKPTQEAQSKSLKLNTSHVSLVVDRAIFWITTNQNASEVYLVDGELKDSQGHVFLKAVLNEPETKKYVRWEGKGQSIQKLSKSWDEKALEVRLAALYPELVRLADDANQDWEKGHVTEQFQKIRKNGWRKASRFQPGPAHSTTNTPQ